MKRAFLIVAALAALLPARAGAGVFSKGQMEEISCAAEKMQLFYYYLSPVKDATLRDNLLKYQMKCVKDGAIVAMPPWIEASVQEMAARKVWRDPEEGDISEAQVWQVPVSIVYEYLTLTKKTFPPEDGGANIAPALLVKEYADIRIRFQMSLDRLYRARTRESVPDPQGGPPRQRDIVMGDSLNSRGRNIVPILGLMLKEMESLADAISSQDSKRYADSVVGSARLSQDAFRVLMSPPRSYKKMPEESSFLRVLHMAMTVFGMILIFLAVRVFFADADPGNSKAAGNFQANVVKYTEAFSRQFIRINVKHLMLAPMVVFGIIGLLTMNVLLFLVFVAVGAKVGMGLPGYVLKMMKQMRGRRIDAQLMDGLILLSNCLRSGLDIVQGFEMVSKDLLPPISDEFGLVIKNYQLGMSFEKALGVMEERVDSKMLSYMIRAITLQRQMGGNLTKVFERIVVDIREESKLDEKTKAMTAQQKIQAIVVGIMPWIMAGVMFMFQPETMIKFYSTGFGMCTAVFCVVWVGIGMKVVSSLGEIKV